VPVVVGQTVTAGQTVVIMESMKMETELAAAVAGTVAVVHVAAGDVVAQGAPLIDIIPAEQVTSRPQVDQPEQT
jgi:biotin carboxyl carrier protein